MNSTTLVRDVCMENYEDDEPTERTTIVIITAHNMLLDFLHHDHDVLMLEVVVVMNNVQVVTCAAFDALSSEYIEQSVFI